MNKIIFGIVVLLTTIQMHSQCACCAGAGIGSSNGDYNNGILTLPKNKLVIEVYSDYRSIKDGAAPEEDEKLLTGMLINSLGARYGLTKKITLSALVPYVNLYTNNGSDSGFGDLIVLATYNLYQKNDMNVALQGGMELPTGIQKSSSFDNTTIVVGSGSYDPMVGALFSKSWNKYTLNSNVLYKFTTKGFQDNYYGSLFVHGISLAYKIKGENSICTLPTAEVKKDTANFGISVFTGYTGEWLDKIKEEDVVDEDSGHYVGLVNFGQIFYIKNGLSL